MTTEKLIKLLQKWPKQFKVTDSRGRSITDVLLSNTSCEKKVAKRSGSIWLKIE